LLINDVPALFDKPASASVMTVTLTGQKVRTATFSSRAELELRLYVLGGGDAIPCEPTDPPPNSVLSVRPDGSVEATWKLPAFASDIAVDPVGGTVVASVSGNNAVTVIDTGVPSGDVGAPNLFDSQLACPTALRVIGGLVYVVTSPSSRINQPTMPALQIGSIEGGKLTPIPFEAPRYEQPIGGTSSESIVASVSAGPNAIYAYDLALSPDGSRAFIGARSRYAQEKQRVEFFGGGGSPPLFSCFMNLDVAEYGLFRLDTRTGAVVYSSRSQLGTNVKGENCEFDCQFGSFYCPTTGGDRPSGLSVLFGSL
jgi:hypothetical protein